MSAPLVKVGQILHLPPERRDSGWAELTVVSIGRKWITLDRNRRCSIDKLLLDRGGYSPKQLYVSRAERENEIALDAAWSAFGRRAIYRRPSAVTLEDIQQASNLLGLPPG
jgi:hypothetical protein